MKGRAMKSNTAIDPAVERQIADDIILRAWWARATLDDWERQRPPGDDPFFADWEAMRQALDREAEQLTAAAAIYGVS